jgi:hypothetical protein
VWRVFDGKAPREMRAVCGAQGADTV